MAKVILYSESDKQKQINNVANITDKSHFVYLDENNTRVEISVDDNGMEIKTNSFDHQTFLYLKENGYAKITTAEGDLIIPLKIIAFTINNDKIVMHYSIEDDKRVIEIIY